MSSLPTSNPSTARVLLGKSIDLKHDEGLFFNSRRAFYVDTISMNATGPWAGTKVFTGVFAKNGNTIQLTLSGFGEVTIANQEIHIAANQFPEEYRPSGNVDFMVVVMDNGNPALGYLRIANGASEIVIGKSHPGDLLANRAFTNGGDAGTFNLISVSYLCPLNKRV